MIEREGGGTVRLEPRPVLSRPLPFPLLLPLPCLPLLALSLPGLVIYIYIYYIYILPLSSLGRSRSPPSLSVAPSPPRLFPRLCGSGWWLSSPRPPPPTNPSLCSISACVAPLGVFSHQHKYSVRQRLLVAGRAAGGTHFVVLHSDELLTTRH